MSLGTSPLSQKHGRPGASWRASSQRCWVLLVSRFSFLRLARQAQYLWRSVSSPSKHLGQSLLVEKPASHLRTMPTPDGPSKGGPQHPSFSRPTEPLKPGKIVSSHNGIDSPCGPSGMVNVANASPHPRPKRLLDILRESLEPPVSTNGPDVPSWGKPLVTGRAWGPSTLHPEGQRSQTT